MATPVFAAASNRDCTKVSLESKSLVVMLLRNVETAEEIAESRHKHAAAQHVSVHMHS